jgi:hypothetical protein
MLRSEVVHLDAERLKRAFANGWRPGPPLATPARTPRFMKPDVPVISAEQNATLGALYRRFHAEADQLIGYMEHIGIAGDASRELRKKLHAVRSEILAARVRRDQTT